MDYSKFTYIEKYDYHTITIKYDFDIKTVTGNKVNTFPNMRSIISYLNKYPDKELYITKSRIDDYHQDGDKIILNFDKYMTFCENIGKSDERKVEAFFSRGLQHISEEEKQKIKELSSIEDIFKILKSYGDKEKEIFVKGFKNIEGIDFSLFNDKNSDDINNVLTTQGFKNNLEGIFFELGSLENKDIIKKQLKN